MADFLKGIPIDYAGFGHITLDLGRIQTEGRLNSKDQEILAVNLINCDKENTSGIIYHFRLRKNIHPHINRYRIKSRENPNE